MTDTPAAGDASGDGPLEGVSTPCLLISSPQMGDPFFERTVVLLWHHDEEGAAGLVINRPLPHKLSAVLEGAPDIDGAEVLWGGPVERGRGTVITPESVPEGEGWPLREGLSVTASLTTLESLLAEESTLLLCLGYAGWGARQLDQEIESGGWLFADATDELVFTDDRETLYEQALATLGLTPQTILMNPADA